VIHRLRRLIRRYRVTMKREDLRYHTDMHGCSGVSCTEKERIIYSLNRAIEREHEL